MSVTSFSLFFGLLAVGCWLGTLAIIVGALVRRFGAPDAFAELRFEVGRAALTLAWVIAAVTMFGSLYYSKVQGYVPCELCWYQRICLYPMAVILGIAAWRRDSSIRIYAIPVLVIGAIISIYHSYIQWWPPSSGTSFCSLTAPCTEKYVNEFGFVTLPFMALSAAVFMITLLMASQGSSKSVESIEEVEASA